MREDFEVNTASFAICELVGSCQPDHGCVVGTKFTSRYDHRKTVTVTKGSDMPSKLYVGGDSATKAD